MADVKILEKARTSQLQEDDLFFINQNDALRQVPAHKVAEKLLAGDVVKVNLNGVIPFIYGSIAELKADIKIKAGMTCKTLGYYSVNDGGGAYYIIRAKNGNDIDDGGSIHVVNSQLVAELIIENGIVNIKHFGAKGDGVTDNTTSIYNACILAKTTGKTLYIPVGTYMSGPVNMSGVVGIIGENDAYSRLVCNTECDVFINWTDTSRSFIKTIRFDGNMKANTVLDVSYNVQEGPSVNNYYEKIFIRGYKKIGMKANNNNDVWWKGVYIAEGAADSIALYAIGACGPITLEDCNFLGGETHISGQYINAINNVFNGLVFEPQGWNNFSAMGNYFFAGNNGANFTFKSTVYSFAVYGGHIENNNGYILSGLDDSIQSITTSLIKFEACHIFSTNDIVNFCRNINFERSNSCIELNGCILDSNIILNTINNIIYNCNNTDGKPSLKSIGGLQLEGVNNISNVAKIKQFHLAFDGVENSKTVNLENPYFCGLVMLKSQMDGPCATFLVSLNGGYGGIVTELHNQAGIASFNGITFTASIKKGKIVITQSESKSLNVIGIMVLLNDYR